MQQKLNWELYSSFDRNKIIDEVKEAISKSDGCIINFNMFSDLALSLSIEIEENSIHKLHETLSCILNISDFDPEHINPESKKEWMIFINISFGSGKGKLKREIPAVPG